MFVCQARSALSALEAFAMEREDEAARLKHEKEELIEELKGVRSGQDRSAEEVRCVFMTLKGGLGRAGGKGNSNPRHFRVWGWDEGITRKTPVTAATTTS